MPEDKEVGGGTGEGRLGEEDSSGVVCGRVAQQYGCSVGR